MAINLLPTANNDKPDKLKQAFLNPPPSTYRTGKSAQGSQPAEFKNPLDMIKQAFNKADKLAGIQKKQPRFPKETGYMSPNVAGSGDLLNLSQNPQAQQVLPFQRPQQQPVNAGVQIQPSTRPVESGVNLSPDYTSQATDAQYAEGPPLPSAERMRVRGNDNVVDENYMQDYQERTGYISDADPRMVQRRKEAEDVHQRRLASIAENEKQQQSGGPNLIGGNLTGVESTIKRSMTNDEEPGSLEWFNRAVEIKNAQKDRVTDVAEQRTDQTTQLGEAQLAQKAASDQAKLNAEQLPNQQEDFSNQLAAKKYGLDVDKFNLEKEKARQTSVGVYTDPISGLPTFYDKKTGQQVNQPGTDPIGRLPTEALQSLMELRMTAQKNPDAQPTLMKKLKEAGITPEQFEQFAQQQR